MIYLLNYFNNEFKFFHEVCIIKKPNPQNIYIPPILKPTYCINAHVQQAGSICVKSLKLQNIQFVVNSFYPQKNGKAFVKIGTTGVQICMDLRIFASFLFPTLLKICSQKFDRKQFYLFTLNFVITYIADPSVAS